MGEGDCSPTQYLHAIYSAETHHMLGVHMPKSSTARMLKTMRVECNMGSYQWQHFHMQDSSLAV